jgi:short subunit dehydrogenase-like uncharacterized protein
MRMNLLIYGANGYTGALIAREAAARGLRPILAGRNAEAVSRLAGELKFDHRAFGLDDPAALDAGLAGVGVVLNCAGPFSRTAKPIADACLRLRTHYLDITGEIDVFEAMAGRDAEAKSAGIMLMPGVGFDVVPSDCLAAHLKRRLQTATRLALGFASFGRPSQGTAATVAENLHRGGKVRKAGKIIGVPAAWKTRVIDFGNGPEAAMSVPWGDVSTAYHSTGIPDIELYMGAPFGQRLGARMSRWLGPVLRRPRVQRFIKRRLRGGSEPGPTAEERAAGKSLLWGEATDDAGGKAVSRLRGPEGYTLTALTAVASARKVLDGGARPGFQTPSMAFGADFVLEVPGVSRTDE